MNPPFRLLSCLSAITLWVAAPAPAQITPAARALAAETAAKLQSAATIRLTARHELAKELGTGTGLDRGPIVVTFRRPNLFHAVQHAGTATREMAYDGRTLCLMHPVAGHHSLVPLRASTAEAFGDAADQRFGFRPPLAELFATDFTKTLFSEVTKADVVGTERVGWTRCRRLHFEQPGLSGDLWVGVKDGLPRRYRLVFTDAPGHPAWDVRLAKWELNSAIDASLFTRRPAADSAAIPLLKSR